ncbi:MAG: hypothetical protein HXN89_08925 [Prevotella pallens]|nr:hypothetical protein [Prevotella pallens]MBF1515947.1 hypothetical protein [Prevotella pallens]
MCLHKVVCHNTLHTAKNKWYWHRKLLNGTWRNNRTKGTKAMTDYAAVHAIVFI